MQKIFRKLPESEWEGFIQWLFEYEYTLLGIPVPSQTIYLRVDPKISQKLISGRYHGDEGKKDIHEANVAYLIQARRAADYCAKHLNWQVVECIRNNAMRSIEDVHADILQIIGG